MLKDDYNKACTEVIEILKLLPKNQYDKIPKEEILFYEKNADKEYEFVFDGSLPINEQKISRTAYAILVTIYRDFFIADSQKTVLEDILNLNRVIKGKRFD